MNYYGIYYKDKEGFEILCSEKGQMFVFSSKEEAKKKLAEFKKFLDDTLNPRIEYKTKPNIYFWEKKRMEEIRPPVLMPWVREELIQQFNTCSIKIISIA